MAYWRTRYEKYETFDSHDAGGGGGGGGAGSKISTHLLKILTTEGTILSNAKCKWVLYIPCRMSKKHGVLMKYIQEISSKWLARIKEVLSAAFSKYASSWRILLPMVISIVIYFVMDLTRTPLPGNGSKPFPPTTHVMLFTTTEYFEKAVYLTWV